MEKDTKGWFHSGRGSVSAEIAKSGAEVLSQESEVAQEGMEPTGEGGKAEDSGAKPVYATGAAPFHEGRGLGRGQ